MAAISTCEPEPKMMLGNKGRPCMEVCCHPLKGQGGLS
jgi:hypothetical protein